MKTSPALSWTAFLAFGVAAPALAQTGPAGAEPVQDERAVERAVDAFGMRIGAEQIGLYTESQVRGFNLQDAGNFRLNGAYFAKSAGIVDTVLGGVTTRVGVNALTADFAAPSGVVDYRLRSPFGAPAMHLELSRREYGGGFADLRLAGGSANGRLAGLAGIQVTRGRSSSGLTPDYDRLGGVIEWRPDARGAATGFVSVNLFDLDGFYGVAAQGPRLPPNMVHPRRYVPEWSDHDGRDLVLGAVATRRLGHDLETEGALVYSQLDLDRADFTLLSVDEAGLGTARTVSNRPRRNSALSGSARLAWRHAPGRRLYGELRGRRTEQAFAPSQSVDLGSFDLSRGLLAEGPEPALSPLPRTHDLTDQVALGLGYEAEFSGWRIKAGVQRSLHRRRIDRPDAEPEQARETPWLYDASAAVALTPGLTAFASATRGLEESGVAPNNATNANEVLPAALSEQRELGLQGRVSEELTLIASLFEIEKPAAGFDAANSYRLIGRLRHRGGELSLTGRLSQEIRLVAGVAYLDASRSGEPVRTGAWSEEAVGLPHLQAMAGVTYSPTRLPGLSLDAQVNGASSRRAASRGDLRSPAMTTVDVGFRFGFRAVGRDLSLRGRVTNLFDADDWVAARSELLDRPARRSGRLSLTMSV